MFCGSKKIATFFAGMIIAFSNCYQTVFGMNEKENSISDDINNSSRISANTSEYERAFGDPNALNNNTFLGTENLPENNKKASSGTSGSNFNESSCESMSQEECEECEEILRELSKNSNKSPENTLIVESQNSFALCNDENINIAAGNIGQSCQCLRFCCNKLSRSIKKHPYIWCAGGAVSIGAGIFIADLYTNHALINAISGLF